MPFIEENFLIREPNALFLRVNLQSGFPILSVCVWWGGVAVFSTQQIIEGNVSPS
jgi:hypothetical protein